MWRALRHRNYRLFFAGQSISLIGTWLTRVATGWLVFRLTSDPFLLGLAGFAGQIPTFLLAPIAGVLIDRWDRHRVLVVCQVLAMLQSVGLAYFALDGSITVAHVLVLNVIQGLINAFDTPARQTFVVEMIEDKGDLSNAIALNSSMVNFARLAGPAIAGVLIAAVGEGWCFAIDAFSYAAVIVSLVEMRVVRRARRPSRAIGAELRDGFWYVARSPAIRAVLALLATTSLMGLPYTVLMPMMSADVFGGGSATNGFLMSASGVGALAGAIFLARRASTRGLGAIIPRAAIGFGASLLVFAVTPTVWLAAPILVLSGFGMIVQMASSNTVIQTIVDEDMRGRVMAFYTMAFFGTTPFGSLIAGALADQIGAPATIAAGGGVCILGGLLFLRVRASVAAALAEAEARPRG
ncbi:MAG: MFS transporter [Deltaproteobacteria bacterium]|nr:MFS transporter [Deltaproteobacteria bacterium]